MRWRGGRSGRSILVTPLLIVSVATMAVLALQAHFAFVYHRATAEKVLRDFAALAGGEFVRRATAQIGYDGHAVLLAELRRRVGPQGLPAAVTQELSTTAEPPVRRAAALARRFFVAAPDDGRISFVPDPPPQQRVSWLMEELPRRGRDMSGSFGAIHAVLDGHPHSVVFAPAGTPAWELVGFEVEPERLRGWFESVLERGALLPPSLGGGRVTNASLSLTVRDHGGVERFRSGAGPWPGLGVEVPFGAAYSGVLEGAVVRVSIDPEAARHLVIGGLPRSRLPILLGLLALSTALVVTAMLQLRRERALQRLRGEFVASVSHELRTPLTQIRMFAETLLLERVRSGDERRRALEIIDREACRLTHLVENVLQFSRSERGVVALARETGAVAPMVREVVGQFHPLIAGTGVRLRTQLDDQAVAAVDADALRQVLLNLLDNAVKYGPREQEIVLTLERSPALVRLSVEDEGPGVPPAERRRIFQRFHRLERDRRAAVAGTGIGLAVARDLVERHGGRCFVEPGSRGGARFVVELPAAGDAGMDGVPHALPNQGSDP